MSTLKVDGIRSNSASSDAITLASDGTCTANITNRSNRNLVINGAMLVAQRGTSGTDAFCCVDRFKQENSGVDEAPTGSQVDVAAGTTPYTLGFRKAFRLTNGNQTGSNTGDYLYMRMTLEAQDIANSGWNYTSASSYITLSFWIKSSVAQNFYGYIRTHDGTNYHYPFETGSLSADTWTKVTKTIPGNSNLQFDNDNGAGLQFTWLGLMGTDHTSSSASLNAWQAVGSGDAYTPDNTTTWYTTNDSTLELTGVQLEVGSVATDFEHRSYAQELALCQRYYISFPAGYIGGGRGGSGGSLLLYSYNLPTPLRASPTFEPSSGWSSSNGIRAYKYNGQSDSTSTPTLGTNGFNANASFLYMSMGGHSIDDDRVASFTHNNTLGINAEL